METASTRGLLSKAAISVREADRLVAGQWNLVYDLESRGCDTSDAEAILDELQRTQARCILRLDRLLAGLGEFDAR
jgi:hypothetical protein